MPSASPDQPTGFAPPRIARRGSTSAYALTVVLLHGRGSNEDQIIGLADRLPTGPSYIAVRAPIAEAGGFAWFANRGVGRPVAESLAATMQWFRTWLDEAVPGPVLLVGFSGGAAFAGGLVLSDPARFAGAAILSGTLPFDAGVPVAPGRLEGVPMFVSQGETDTVIPAELLYDTWQYLTGPAGADTTAVLEIGGHNISADVVEKLSTWITRQVSRARRGTP